MARYPLNLPTQLKLDAEWLAARQGVSLNQFILWAVAEKIGELRQYTDATTQAEADVQAAHVKGVERSRDKP